MAEVDPDPEASTPPHGISERGIENRRDFAKELHPVPRNRIRHADWRRDSWTVGVRFDELNITVSPKTEQPSMRRGSQQVELLGKGLPFRSEEHTSELQSLRH